jgi:hypothetical protein|tara:strand:- start:28 stop:255 length:228 start_codon:yes stop_codon:yes gene_type:complete
MTSLSEKGFGALVVSVSKIVPPSEDESSQVVDDLGLDLDPDELEGLANYRELVAGELAPKKKNRDNPDVEGKEER